MTARTGQGCGGHNREEGGARMTPQGAADIEVLGPRSERLAPEPNRERSALCHRYADPRARWLPVTVTFLVPAPVKG